jgi:hypothetical protein
MLLSQSRSACKRNNDNQLINHHGVKGALFRVVKEKYFWQSLKRTHEIQRFCEVLNIGFCAVEKRNIKSPLLFKIHCSSMCCVLVRLLESNWQLNQNLKTWKTKKATPKPVSSGRCHRGQKIYCRSMLLKMKRDTADQVLFFGKAIKS